MSRAAEAERRSLETQVSVRLDLDGTGAHDVQTPNPFLTHMVEAWARHAAFDVRLRAAGDLDHHIVEDTAIALGQAFRAAFALAPCQRIAHDVAPMDDALVLVAVDLVDRPYYEGELPIPLWEHFLRSFATEARINLHVQVLRGRDTHHAVEAAVKGFARALRRALEPREREVSTKGTVQFHAAAAPPEAAPSRRPAPGAPSPATPLSIEDQEMLAAVEKDPAEEGWSWRQGIEETGVRKALKDPTKGVLEVRHVAKDGRPRLEAKGKRKKPAAPDPGTVVAPPRPQHDSGPLPDEAHPEAANVPHVKPESLAAASKEVRSRLEKAELPEVKAAR
ncbi:MAG TPA: imidazoleglycerol-phosphate dehydratase, partial [Candidatus Thermoplasmatota archaeon]|nr:imidazoleglycerol-phosphate dehydratase [Candidatus Thermoplasmatota archaeon]